LGKATSSLVERAIARVRLTRCDQYRGDGQLDDRRLLFFVRNPQQGAVKSRLAGAMGEEAAGDLYKNFILDMLCALKKGDFPFSVCFYPADALEKIKKIFGAQYRYLPQHGADLGERMEHCFSLVFSAGIGRAVLIGSDLPDLPLDIIDEAFAFLRKAGAVIGPALDGGYYLIGFTKDGFTPEIFRAMPWGTETVFRQTIDMLQNHQRTIHLLPSWGDIDSLEDLQKFFERNRETPRCPRTMTYLKDKNVLAGRR
jgi:rSAM/selenodomain-associated transferase 1